MSFPETGAIVRHVDDLIRNVRSGFRLGLFLRVSRDEFRVGAMPFAVLCLFNVLVWIAGGAIRTRLNAEFNLAALPDMLASVAVLLLVCLLLARLLRNEALLPALAVMLASTDALFEIIGTGIFMAIEGEWVPALPSVQLGLYAAYIAWVIASAIRAQLLLAPWRSPGARSAAALLVITVLAFAYVPRDEPWITPDEAGDGVWSEVLQEDQLHRQGAMLGQHIDRLAPQRPGVEDLYFLGVAPYSLQSTFVSELAAVRELLDRRFDTQDRSLVLANHPDTLAVVPLATASNLRAALARLGESMNVEEDVLFLHIATHGTTNHELAFAWPPLRLQQVNPTMLARMLADSGIKWKVIVISACYSGGFIEPLRDANTLIITASDAAHSSFGCESTSNMTWFSRAFFEEALRDEAAGGGYSLEAAFDKAKVTVAQREKEAGYEPSNPQIAVGADIRNKWRTVASRLAGLPRAPAAPVGAPQVQASVPPDPRRVDRDCQRDGSVNRSARGRPESFNERMAHAVSSITSGPWLPARNFGDRLAGDDPAQLGLDGMGGRARCLGHTIERQPRAIRRSAEAG